MARILVVDDEPDIRTLLRIALDRSNQFEVVLASSGAEAISAVALKRPDLVVLDVMMPIMDGLETLSHIRAIPGCADTPVVFLTARTQSRQVEAYLSAGAVLVIAKPFKPLELVEKLQDLIGEAQ